MAGKKGTGKKKAAAKPKAKSKKAKKLAGALDPAADFDKPARKPRQARLPEMEDPQIDELDALAEAYADALDRRTRALAEEKSHKKDILNKMKELDRMIYRHAGVFIQRSIESEKVRVVIKKTPIEEPATQEREQRDQEEQAAQS